MCVFFVPISVRSTGTDRILGVDNTTNVCTNNPYVKKNIKIRRRPTLEKSSKNLPFRIRD